MVSGDAVVEAKVGSKVPSRKDVPPLHPTPIVEPIGGRAERVACRPEKGVQSDRPMESIPVVDESHADEAVAVDVIQLYTRSQVAVL